MNEPVHPQPTEKSQVVIQFTNSSLVVRFNSVKKGEQELAKLKKAWARWQSSPTEKFLHDLDGDMFVSSVSLVHIVAVSFVDFKKRAAFVPVQ